MPGSRWNDRAANGKYLPGKNILALPFAFLSGGNCGLCLCTQACILLKYGSDPGARADSRYLDEHIIFVFNTLVTITSGHRRAVNNIDNSHIDRYAGMQETGCWMHSFRVFALVWVSWVRGCRTRIALCLLLFRCMLNIEILISVSPLPLANQLNQPANQPSRQTACLFIICF